MSRRDVLKIGVFTAAGAAVGGALGWFGGASSRQPEVDSLNARLRFLAQQAGLPPLSAEVRMYNWTLYTNYALLDAFEDKTGVFVNYNETAETQDDFRSRLKLGNPDNFDIMVVTDYAVQEAIQLDLLEPLDHGLIPNLDFIDPDFPTPWDPGHTYSLPYLWGTTGIGWNTARTRFPSGQTTVNSWNQLFDVGAGTFLDLNQGRVTLQADRDEALAAAAIYLGKDINDLSPSTLQEVEDTLIAVKPYLADFADASQYYDGLFNEDFWVSHAWSGDVLFVRETGQPNVTYAIPQEGAHIWTDNYVIPKNAPNKETAMFFINYMWEASNQAVLAMFRNYYVANRLALWGGDKSQGAFAAQEEPYGMILPYVWGLPDINPLVVYPDRIPDPRAPLMQRLQPRTEQQNAELAALWDRVLTA